MLRLSCGPFALLLPKPRSSPNSRRVGRLSLQRLGGRAGRRIGAVQIPSLPAEHVDLYLEGVDFLALQPSHLHQTRALLHLVVPRTRYGAGTHLQRRDAG